MPVTNPKPTAPAKPGKGSSNVTPGGGVEGGPESSGTKPLNGAGKAPSVGYHDIDPKRGSGAPVIGGQPTGGPEREATPTGAVSTSTGPTKF